MNSRRMNRLEELGRVDAEKAFSKKGKRNLRDEKSRIVEELKKADGGKVESKKRFPIGPGPKRRKVGPGPKKRKDAPKGGAPVAPSPKGRGGDRSKPKVIRIIEVNKENVMADGGKVVGDYVEKKKK